MIVKKKKSMTPFQKYFLFEADEPETKPRTVDKFKVSPSSRRRDFSSIPEPENTTDTEEEPVTTPSTTMDDSFSGEEDPETTRNTVSDNTTQEDDTEENDQEGEDAGDGSSPTTDDTSDFSNDDETEDSDDSNDTNDEETKEVDEQDEDGMKKFILYKKYIRLYENIERYIDRLESMMQNDIHKNMVISNARMKLQELHTLMKEYMLYKFSDENYIQSLLFFQSCVAVVHLNIEALQNVKITREDNNN